MTGDLHGKVVTFCHHLILQSRISCWLYFRICSCPSSKVSMVDQVLTFHRILVWIPQPQRSSILEHIASVKGEQGELSWGDHRSRTCRCSRWHGSLISKQPTSSVYHNVISNSRPAPFRYPQIFDSPSSMSIEMSIILRINMFDLNQPFPFLQHSHPSPQLCPDASTSRFPHDHNPPRPPSVPFTIHTPAYPLLQSTIYPIFSHLR